MQLERPEKKMQEENFNTSLYCKTPPEANGVVNLNFKSSIWIACGEGEN